VAVGMDEHDTVLVAFLFRRLLGFRVLGRVCVRRG